VFVRCKDAAKESNALANLAAYRLATEDLAAARECARSALQRAREAESRVNALVALQHLAAIAALQQQARLAAMLLGFVDAAGLSPAYTETFTHEKALSALHDQLSGADLERLMKDGTALSRDEAFAMASSIV
jgi:hypothetical protein